MLQSFLKISTLLLCLCIHTLRVSTIGTLSATCRAGFTINQDGTALCKDNDDSKVVNYNCPHSRCWCQNNQWSPFSGCRLKRNKAGPSNQHCAQYDFISGHTFSCKNPAGIDYICVPSPSDQPPPMACDTCSRQN
ncbi:uncharacterized protein MELLADRAFT_123793 [Melampsora larici-populina 98AG31]|uniref:Secreted protein n=1 Tax=Melampsora larici-populina (strain 98AG31 / pathotype 3-4-7) TaxID=747676 RepID=F4R5P2_MELLP|nr:uncharacterized protein MELLADRAFT_123793 [Melampsora larici-populina 98AG31]EGG12228.1 secreted protein [Melampsora larici-populina 98AG31]